MFRYTLLILILVSVSATAAVYRWVDESGNLQFSDREPSGGGAEKIEVSPASTYSPRQLPETILVEPTDSDGQGALTYKRIEIIKPEQDATVRDNNGRVEIQLALEPGLRNGHRLALMMDGEPVFDRLNTTSVALTSVERGSHQIEVRVFDRNGAEVAASEPVTFHLHRASALIPRPQPAPLPVAPRS